MKKLTEKRSRAISMRMRGLSYSHIKKELNVSKSSLSLWLNHMPLSKDRICELRNRNEQVIEKCRNTKLKKRQTKLENVYLLAKKDIGFLSKRELFLAGLFLYWGEGTKVARDVVAFTNTDPNMMRFFVMWIKSMGVQSDKLKVKLHLYSDMDVKKQTTFWSLKLGIPVKNFWKPYVKDSSYSSLTYKKSFGQGTCSVHYGNTDLHNKIMMSLRYVREIA